MNEKQRRQEDMHGTERGIGYQAWKAFGRRGSFVSFVERKLLRVVYVWDIILLNLLNLLNCDSMTHPLSFLSCCGMPLMI